MELQNHETAGKKEEERTEEGGEIGTERNSVEKKDEAREGVRACYVVCAWRGWRLPHEALRAELSYPHIRTYIAERGAGPDLITLPYT